MTDDGRLLADRRIKLDSAEPVLSHKAGDDIRVGEDESVRLAGAFFVDLGRKFLLAE